ncbi:MAG: DUF4293 domain-containing protein, partial [Bacteroidota bacterium]
ADTPNPVADSALFEDASYTIFDAPLLIGLFAFAGVVLLATIFLFKNRPLQMKLTLAGIVLVAFAIGYGAYQLFTDSAAALATPDIGVALPVLAIIFSFLAQRYIKKDEKLVRSADRLR